MNKSLAISSSTHSTDRILAIEPDLHRADTLRDTLGHDSRIDLAIVASGEEAVRAFAERVPDLILASTFLPPADEAMLTARVKELPAASHVQVITIPYFIDSDEAQATAQPGSRVLAFLRPRPPKLRPRCDVLTLRRQIDEYLAYAKARRSSQNRAASDARLVKERRTLESGTQLIKRPETAPPPSSTARGLRSGLAMPADRRTARRQRSVDLPSPWSAKVSGIGDVSVVDISSRGVLLEMGARVPDGSTIDLELSGEDATVTARARMVRSQVAEVSSRGVRYRVAAAFTRPLDALGLREVSSAGLSPRVLVDLLAHVLADSDKGIVASSVRLRFEHELRQLLRVRDVQIRHAPGDCGPDTEATYFRILQDSQTGPILQVIFDRGHQLSASEFRFMKAAAGLAAAVLEFAPLDDGRPV